MSCPRISAPFIILEAVGKSRLFLHIQFQTKKVPRVTLNWNILASCQVHWKRTLQNLTCRNVREEKKRQAASRIWHVFAVKSERKQTHLVGVVCTDAVASAITLIMHLAVFFSFFYTSVHMTEKGSTIDPEVEGNTRIQSALLVKNNRWRVSSM